jgi:hypothetical protein
MFWRGAIGRTTCILTRTQRDSHNNQTTLALMEKLAEEIAIILALRLGYSDYRQLLKDVHNNTSTPHSADPLF